MQNIGRPDSKMPGAPHVKTYTASHFELTVHAKIVAGYPSTVKPPTKPTMGDETACA